MSELSIIPEDILKEKIYFIRGQKVMLDFDLASLYQVETKVLKQAVRRNINRFPNDFMFEMTVKELETLRSQIVTSKKETRGGIRFLPFCFTEPGVAMLSSVLNSEVAINVNIQIIRTFIRLREAAIDKIDLRLEIEKIKSRLDNQDKNMEIVFRCLDELIERKTEATPRKRIGYKSEEW